MPDDPTVYEDSGETVTVSAPAVSPGNPWIFFVLLALGIAFVYLDRSPESDDED